MGTQKGAISIDKNMISRNEFVKTISKFNEDEKRGSFYPMFFEMINKGLPL